MTGVYVALGMDGTRTPVRVDGATWYLVFPGCHPKKPELGPGFHFRHIVESLDGRWFLFGTYWTDRRYGPENSARYDLPHLWEVKPEVAAEYFVATPNCPLPPGLARIVFGDITSAASGNQAPPPEAPAVAAPGRNGKAAASGTAPLPPAARAVGAAYALKKDGKPLSVRSACKAAGVDRKNLADKHPETIRLIEQLGEPDRTPPRGRTDRRTGNLDAVDEPDDD